MNRGFPSGEVPQTALSAMSGAGVVQDGLFLLLFGAENGQPTPKTKMLASVHLF